MAILIDSAELAGLAVEGPLYGMSFLLRADKHALTPRLLTHSLSRNRHLPLSILCLRL